MQVSHFAQVRGERPVLISLHHPKSGVKKPCYLCPGCRCRLSFAPFALSQQLTVVVALSCAMAMTLGCQKWFELMACSIHSPVVQVEKYCNYNCCPESLWEFFLRFREKVANLRSQHFSRKSLSKWISQVSRGAHHVIGGFICRTLVQEA